MLGLPQDTLRQNLPLSQGFPFGERYGPVDPTLQRVPVLRIQVFRPRAPHQEEEEHRGMGGQAVGQESCAL